MRRTFLTLVMMLTVVSGLLAQMEQHISWQFSTKMLEDNKVEVICEATVDNGWHVYSSVLPEGTAIPTYIEIEESDAYTILDGINESPEPTKHYDETFGAEMQWFEGNVKFSRVVQLKEQNNVLIKGYVESMICNDETCMPPEMVDFELQVGQTNSKETVQSQDAAEAEESMATTEEEEESYWAIFLLAFGGGLAALLTPCVFPMIPMTVSFFTKQSATKAAGIRNAITYGLSIIAIYVILGVAVSAIFGASALNALSTNVWFNLFFFLLLVVFAASFFGAFEIVMPSSWVNFTTKNEDKGGIIGIFFMAFTLALVSFSCTGPIVGSLLVKAATGGYMGPIIGMLGFSLALALPFALFAAFPGYLNSLPKSGGWLNSVKVILGFLELAFAFKFLSIADMTMGWHILEREVFIAIWIAIFAAMGFYLMGKIKLPHDSPMNHVPVSRFMMALVVFSFTIYLIPGLWGAPVSLISGFPPPKNYAESPYGVGNETPGIITGADSHAFGLPEGMHPGPQGIPAFDDYETALAYSKKVNKPMLLDFTGLGCTNCRKMEDAVWSNQSVKSILTNDYILVSLYVDDRKKLDEVYVSEVTGKKIRTVGQKWAEFQFERYQQQGQPYYVIVDEEENTLNKPVAYDPDVERYKNWLLDGLKKFNEN
ncbi:protein-disulfide reductase DsbD family protein [Carboxylicivirga linearis]|uniref:Thioredoxin family protein n=1 Tax=Carboxylicivirga linearis TaxID=1628157 RepID=A0ABS5JRH9_9BACT|nr:thioredoxin family protein [Carboxylicivirga linearis]MBS2097096.1 thioredoxin family protein [Carboxylicivirga linearis]